jgi:carbonic anhydrase
MKSSTNNIVRITILFLCLTFLKSAQFKKSETVLEFFNNFFSSEETSKLENEYLSQTSNSFAMRNETNNSSTTNSTNDEMIQEWLRISTPDFSNKNKYPPVILPNGDQVKIQTDSNYFRINIAYDETNKEGPQNPLDFWFRITPSQMYYSKDKTDYNVLGSISYTGVAKDSDSSRYCFNILEHDNSYLICSTSNEIRRKVFCQLKKNLDEKLPYECSTANKEAGVDISKLPQPIVIDDKVIQPIILIPLPSKECNEGWTYLNKGKDWSCGCSEGSEQSPIDLPDPRNAISSPVMPLFQYDEVSAKSKITTLDGELKAEDYMKIKYFKGALRIFHSNFGKIVTLDGAVYIAEEIVFHTPAEHTIDGKRYDMEMQVIHYGQTKGDISKQVVLSFLFEKKPGVYNKFIDDVDFFSLPNPLNKERDIINNLYLPKVFYSSTDENISTMKPFSFFTYQGSLTFPPCSERTIHYVASDPIPIGSAPLQLMKEALMIPDMKNENNGAIIITDSESVENYRETQPLNERPVFHFSHKKYCGGEINLSKNKDKEVIPYGHYEKLSKKATEYFYVTSSEPSGIPNSFVVSEKEAKGQEQK